MSKYIGSQKTMGCDCNEQTCNIITSKWERANKLVKEQEGMMIMQYATL